MNSINMKMNVICRCSVSKLIPTKGQITPDLHPILEFGYDGAVRNEREKLALHRVGQGDDEKTEDGHLQHQEGEHLDRPLLSANVTS